MSIQCTKLFDVFYSGHRVTVEFGNVVAFVVVAAVVAAIVNVHSCCSACGSASFSLSLCVWIVCKVTLIDLLRFWSVKLWQFDMLLTQNEDPTPLREMTRNSQHNQWHWIGRCIHSLSFTVKICVCLQNVRFWLTRSTDLAPSVVNQ